jgi:hypothetical protein
VKQLLQGARSLSPYLLVEVLLPGGTVIALLLWLFRRYQKGNADVHLAEKPSSIHAADLGAGGAAGLCTGDCA